MVLMKYVQNTNRGAFMNNELIKYDNDGVELEVNVSLDEETVWLTTEQIGLLFDRDRSVVSKHIKNIYKDKELDENATCAKNAQVQTEGERRIKRTIEYYNLDVIVAVGRRTKSKNCFVFYNWVKDTLLLLKRRNINTESNIIRFEKGNLSLDVTIVPEDETVYLSKDQLVLLFDTTRQNIEYHINNIYEIEELERAPTRKEILQVQNEGNRQVSRYQCYYNLEMIISLGYRVNTKRGIEFRRWATSVLKEYLRKGYIVNDDRVLVTKQNFDGLVNKVDSLDERLSKVEDNQKHLLIEDKIFFENQMFDALVLINQIVETAKESIVLIDPYADERTLNAFKKKGGTISLIIITSSKNKLSEIDIKTYVEEYGELTIKIDDRYHDRFLIIDHQIFYRLGSSINYMGKRFTEISKVVAEDSVELIKKRLTESAV